MESNKHAVRYNSCNIGEILDVPIDIPLNPLYSPVLSIYVYDHVLGLIGTRIIGITHIPLGKIVRKTLRGFLERRRRLGYKERESFEKSVQFVELSKSMISRKRKDLVNDAQGEARLNKSLNRLQIMIDKGQVDLQSVMSGVTEEHAIDDILKDMEKKEKDADEEMKFMKVEYEFTDEDYQDLEDYFEEEEESEEEGESSEELSSYSKTPNESQKESTIKSNDVNLGFEEDDDDSDDSEDRDSRRDSRGYSKLNNSSMRKTKTKKSRRNNKTEYEKLNNSNSRYLSKTQSRRMDKRSGANNLISKEGRVKGIQDKQNIERVLSGYTLRKDKVKKLAQQKILQHKFREKAKEDALAEEDRKEAERNRLQKDFVNSEKRRKLKTKQSKNISLQAQDTDSEEDLSMIPEYLKGRETYEDELEDAIITKKPFYRSNILTGQTRGQKGWFFKKVVNTQSVSGVLKGIPLIQMPDDDPDTLYKEYKKFLDPSNLVCRVYVLKGKSLTPKDSRNSDPYIVLKCGAKKVNDEKNAIDDTNNPGFYKHFDIPVTVPGASTLHIEVWDDDGIVGDDLIGATKIDLEERWFSPEWRELNDAANILSNEEERKKLDHEESKIKELSENKETNEDEKNEEEKKEMEEELGATPRNQIKKVPIEERTLISKTSAAPQGILECWIELMNAKEAKQRKPADVRPFPKKPMEIRVIVWGTKDVTFMDTQEK